MAPLSHLHDVALVGDRERAEGRLAEEMTIHPSAIVAKSAAAVGSPAALARCELSLGCPPGPDRGSWSCEASAIIGRTG
jgi:hypothetical protein